MPTSRRPRAVRAPLTRERIASAALALLDREGEAGLTMRALGRDLGVEAMALYHHFPDREALMAEVVARCFAPLELPREGPWEAALLELAWAFREVALAHPAAFRMRVAGASPEAEAWLAEALLSILVQAGFPPLEASRAYLGTRAFLEGSILATLNPPLAATSDHPHLHRCAPALGQDHAKAHFAFGLQRLCAELRRQLRTHPVQPQVRIP